MKKPPRTPHVSDDPATVSVCADPPGDDAQQAAAARLAEALGLALLSTPAEATTPLLLAVTPDRLELRVVAGDPALQGGRPIAVDLAAIDTRSPTGRSLRQPLMRAVGIRKGVPDRPDVLDATGGFGEDAWLLASAGCRVVAVERSPVVAALLRDAVARAGRREPATRDRLRVVQADSVDLLRQIAAAEGEFRVRGSELRGGKAPRERGIRTFAAEGPAWGEMAKGTLPGVPEVPWVPEVPGVPEVVYLDPMFPPGRKTAERKPMRVLRWLVGPETDAAELLAAARSAARRRVVVKRPLRAEPLAGVTPTATHKGNSVRYDVYVGEGGPQGNPPH